MKQNFVIFDESEEIIKEFTTKSLRVVITGKRLVIEDVDVVFSIRLDVIGVVQFIRKSGKKYCLRLYSKAGKDLFPFLNNCRIDFLNREDAVAFESILSNLIY